MSWCHWLSMLVKGLNVIVSLVIYVCERFKCHCVLVLVNLYCFQFGMLEQSEIHAWFTCVCCSFGIYIISNLCISLSLLVFTAFVDSV